MLFFDELVKLLFADCNSSFFLQFTKGSCTKELMIIEESAWKCNLTTTICFAPTNAKDVPGLDDNRINGMENGRIRGTRPITFAGTHRVEISFDSLELGSLLEVFKILCGLGVQ